MKQYTIRNIPNDLDTKLRSLAQRRKRSLNKTIVDQLQWSVQQPKPKTKINHDFDDLIGKMEYDPEFGKIIKEGRQIDWKDWQ